MTAILTAAEMRALERAAIASGEVTGLELMERAGRGVVDAILAEWPGIEEGAKRAVVLCGPGNNGGDGFVVARLLKERGWAVEVFLYGDAERLPPDAKVNHDLWASLGAVNRLDPSEGATLSMEAADYGPGSLIVDAIFGIGLTRPMDAAFGEIGWWTLMCSPLAADAESPSRAWPAARVVAVDVPSGLDADSGTFLRPSPVPRDHEAIRADLTVTFHGRKPGHLLEEGPLACGRLSIVDIGLPPRAEPPLLSFIDDVPGKAQRIAKRAGHKYGYGHAVILSGGPGYGGAARMAARGALRIGAGLVTLAVPPAALQENAAALTAIMLRSLKDPEALTAYLADARLNALCVGPGFGTGEKQAAMLAALLDASRAAPADAGQGAEAGNSSDGNAGASVTSNAQGAGASGQATASIESSLKPAPARPARAVVLDADALMLLSKDETLRTKLHDRCVLTPHEGEFARLFPETFAKWRAPATSGPAYSKVDAARDAARAVGCVVLLKGPDTVIADPLGRAAINAAVYDRAAPWLATAGSGDVLAGFITGLLARGFAPFDAACTAAWLHVECARSFGPGLIAEDLPEELPKVFRALGL